MVLLGTLAARTLARGPRRRIFQGQSRSTNINGRVTGMVQKRVTAQGGVAGVDARRATPPDPRPPRWGLAGCCQLDPSHPTIITCAVGRASRRAPRPMTLGANHVSRCQKGGDPAASGDLRLGHRAPGRGGRRASIPLHALTTRLSALGAVGLFEPRVARICLGNLRYICLDNGNASQGADNTSVRAWGVLSVGIPRFLDKSQHFTIHLFRL